MDNNYLDKVIKALLEQYDAGDPGNTWDALHSKLDTVHDAKFDETIKSKINDLEEVYDAATWTTLVAAISQLDANSTIEELLDQKAKNLLEDIEPTYEPSSWELLQNKLQLEDDLSNIEIPEEVDLAAYGSLGDLDVPYNENDWNKFQKQLDREFVLPYTLLFKYKLAEVAILLLFLLGVTQFIPLKKANKIFAKQNIEATTDNDQQLNEAAPLESTQATTHSVVKEITNENRPATENSIVNTSNSDLIASSATSNTLLNTDLDVNNNDNSAVAISERLTQDEVNYENSRILSQAKTNEVTSIAVNPLAAATQITKESDSEQSDANDPVLDNPSLLEATSLARFTDFSDNIVPDCIVCRNPVSLLRWRMTAQLNVDYNYIMTPYDNALSVKSYEHAALGYGAGLATSLGLGRWDLELGANYISRKYTPKPISERVGNILDGYLNFELDKIELNLLNIPLHIRYYFKTKKKTEVFLSGGASMNVAMQANYFRKAEFASRQRTPDLTKADQLLEETLINTQKIYSLGFIDGGNFLENRFFTADLGLGIERKISHRYSIFGQANYQHFLDSGIGPNKDRFNSLSLSAGARALFR